MDKRRAELSTLSSYIRRIDSELTMILQSLQWDRKHLTEGSPMAVCRYDPNHRVPPDKLQVHERECWLRSLGYSRGDMLLPQPLDDNADTVVTLSKTDITNIIEYAAKIDPLFKKGRGPEESQPLTLERLQVAYSTDERRAIHDAVVSAVPSCHDLMELALPAVEGTQQQQAAVKSRAEILAELRDMRRRRTKYRGAAKSRNYSDVLRDLITTQMEHYSDAQATANRAKNLNTPRGSNSSMQNEEVRVKKEPADDRPYSKEHEYRQRDNSKDKYKEREREKRHDDYKRDKHRDERDRYSSSSKDRDRMDYRSKEKYRKDDRRDSRDSSRSRPREYGASSRSSKNGDSRYKYERGDRYDSYDRSHKQDKHKRYYDCSQDEFQSTSKRIKHEKD